MIEAIEALKNSEKVIVDEDHDWGYQLRLINNDLYCGKFLVLDANKSGSYHYHTKKKETFIHLYGSKIQLKKSQIDICGRETYVARRCILPGDSVTFNPFEAHEMRMLRDNVYDYAVILEVSTHDDNNDIEYVKENSDE